MGQCPSYPITRPSDDARSHRSYCSHWSQIVRSTVVLSWVEYDPIVENRLVVPHRPVVIQSSKRSYHPDELDGAIRIYVFHRRWDAKDSIDNLHVTYSPMAIPYSHRNWQRNGIHNPPCRPRSYNATQRHHRPVWPFWPFPPPTMIPCIPVVGDCR